MTGDLWRLDGVALAGLILAGEVSARQAVTSHLERMRAVNPRLNAVVRTLEEQALAEADLADRAQRAGEPLGPLHGLPVKLLRWPLKRLDLAFRGFFQRVRQGQTPGFPRFRSANRWRAARSRFGSNRWGPTIWRLPSVSTISPSC